MNKVYEDLNPEEKKAYWALMSIYELTAHWVRDERADNEAFNDAFKNVQDALKIELFSETSRLDILDFSYIQKYGNTFKEAVERDGHNYIQWKDKEFELFERIDDQCELLSKQKMARNQQDIVDGNYPEDDNLVPITDFGLYKCSIPLLTNDKRQVCTCFLDVGVMSSYQKPTGEQFLEVCPIDKIQQSAEEHFKKTGKDVSKEAFNSFQECRHNPDLISIEKITPEEWREIVNSQEQGV